MAITFQNNDSIKPQKVNKQIKKRENYVPMVVTTVPAKKKDWPKLQFGSEETLRVTATPRFVALTTSNSRESNSCSLNSKTK